MLAQKRATSSGRSSTRNAQPWLKPAFGARTALASIRSTDGRVDRPLRVASDHPARAYDVLELHEGDHVLCPLTSSRCGATSRRSAGRRRSGGYFRSPFASAERECRRVVPRAVRGPRPRRRARRRTATWWPGGGPTGRRRRTRCSPARTSTPSSTAGRTTARSAWSRRWPPSTCCATAGVVPTRPIGVGVFVEEEGSRFGLACLGSRLATGTIDAGTAPARSGTATACVLDARTRGRRRARRTADLLAGVGCFVELHVEQGRDLVDREAAGRGGQPRSGRTAATASSSPARPTTRAPPAMEDRHDPMLTYAMTVLAANKQARLAGQRATFGRLDVRPQRHQRGPVPGHRLAGRARPSPPRTSRRCWPTWSGWPRSAPAGTAPRCR